MYIVSRFLDGSRYGLVHGDSAHLEVIILGEMNLLKGLLAAGVSLGEAAGACVRRCAWARRYAERGAPGEVLPRIVFQIGAFCNQFGDGRRDVLRTSSGSGDAVAFGSYDGDGVGTRARFAACTRVGEDCGILHVDDDEEECTAGLEGSEALVRTGATHIGEVGRWLSMLCCFVETQSAFLTAISFLEIVHILLSFAFFLLVIGLVLAGVLVDEHLVPLVLVN